MVEPRELRDLSEDEIRQIAIQTARATPDDLSIGLIGAGPLSRMDLVHEIEQGTELGERFVEAVRDHSIFLQEAVRAGKVVAKAKAEHEVEMPPFDF